ncbi:hypothetical protein AWV80_32490 [Cupriavidus sp. UYMU48A]|nr:hypothetical protein AWV80_32490 [Cupriavidus sp. UYMU48A]
MRCLCLAVPRTLGGPSAPDLRAISRHIERNGLRAAAGDGIGGNGRRLTAVQHQQDVVARAHTEPLLHVTGQSEARVNQVAIGGAATATLSGCASASASSWRNSAQPVTLAAGGSPAGS